MGLNECYAVTFSRFVCLHNIGPFVHRVRIFTSRKITMHRAVSFFVAVMKQILIGILFFASVLPAFGQDWMQTQAPSEMTQTPYFLNPAYGFEFSAAFGYRDITPIPTNGLGIVNSGFFRTTDGGSTWTALHFFDSLHISITQLCFVTPGHGFASTSENVPNLGEHGGVFETLDSGNSWKRISPNGCAYAGVYASGRGIFACEVPDNSEMGSGTLLFSTDEGSTWDSLTQYAPNPAAGFLNVVGNKDSLVATTIIDQTQKATLICSTDGGKNWQRIAIPSADKDALAVFAYPHQCRVIMQYVTDSDRNTDTYSFSQADPPYTSWTPSFFHDEESGRWVAGNACAMYIANSWDPGVMVNRSVDSWTDWKPILTGGIVNPCIEIDDHDFRNISVVGYGAVVFIAAGTDGELWKTTDGGDGTLSAAALAPRIEYQHGAFPSGNDTLTVSPCSSSSALVYYQNLRCAITKMDSVFLDGLAPQQYSLTTTHHDDCLSLPDTTYINFASLPIGFYPITIHSHFTDDEYNTIDTSLSFILDVSGASIGERSGQEHREAASAYIGGFDTLPLAVDISSNLNIDSLWPFLTDIQAIYTWDSSVVSFSSYDPPLGWTVTSISPHGNSVDFSIHKVSSTISTPLNLGTAIFQPNGSALASSWVTLPNLVLIASGETISLCIGQNEDSHWSVKTLGTSGVASVQVPTCRLYIYPNPGMEEVTIFSAGVHHVHFTITDPLGRSYAVPQRGNVLDISSLPSGIYFVSDGFSGEKFVKE